MITSIMGHRASGKTLYLCHRIQEAEASIPVSSNIDMVLPGVPILRCEDEYRLTFDAEGPKQLLAIDEIAFDLFSRRPGQFWKTADWFIDRFANGPHDLVFTTQFPSQIKESPLWDEVACRLETFLIKDRRLLVLDQNTGSAADDFRDVTVLHGKWRATHFPPVSDVLKDHSWRCPSPAH